jgi:hypothetical protein
MRYFFACFLVMTGLMIVTAPVTAIAMSDAISCPQRLQVSGQLRTNHHSDVAQDHGADHMSLMHHHPDHKMTQSGGEAEAQVAAACCDHACVFEMPGVPVSIGIALAASGTLHNGSSEDLTELTHPNGLRRPPKA